MRRRENPFDFFVLVVLCIFGAVLGRAQTLSRQSGQVHPITSVAQSFVQPVASAGLSTTTFAGEFFYGLFAARRLTAENRRLVTLAQSAEMYGIQIRRLEDEVARLRALSGFAPLIGRERVAAEVVGFAPYENRLTLNVGTKQGIRRGMPVQAPDGLVGTVQNVEPQRSQVLLLTSASLTLGAMDLDRNPPQAGLLRGEDTNSLTLTFQDPKAPVEIGDRIVTSGFSDKIPRGIFIGKVIAVEADEEFGSLRARVAPYVAIGNLREVYVLK